MIQGSGLAGFSRIESFLECHSTVTLLLLKRPVLFNYLAILIKTISIFMVVALIKPF